jgi:hypothetical protein
VGEEGRKGGRQGICGGRHRLRQGGYAVTSHSSQGQTADRVLIHADTELGAKDLLNNRMAYVAVSRGAYGGGGFMVASSKAAYEIPGEKSPVRFHSAPELVFVVRSSLAQTDTDPATFYVLRKLDPKKKNREIAFSTGHFTPLGGHVTTNLNAGQLPLAFARYGASSYRVTASNLAPGEYALSRIYGQDVFCFGID